MMPTEAAAISEVSHVAWFSKMACLYTAKRPQLPYNVPTAGGRSEYKLSQLELPIPISTYIAIRPPALPDLQSSIVNFVNL